ncbi:MAG: DUF3489 domain-containing protein [Paracoccaceae bacterium]|nr:DUF3489 domain-containing protein [Paracoccaceae bacterium]
MAKARQTKTDEVRAMLTRPQGARLDAICKATGWQPHSARAALSGLRKAGYMIEREAAGDGKGGCATYRIAAAPAGGE